MIFIAQQGARHKPNGPFWTGHYWSVAQNHRKLYSNEEEAAADVYMAVKSARQTVLAINKDTVFLKLTPKRGT